MSRPPSKSAPPGMQCHSAAAAADRHRMQQQQLEGQWTLSAFQSPAPYHLAPEPVVFGLPLSPIPTSLPPPFSPAHASAYAAAAYPVTGSVFTSIPLPPVPLPMTFSFPPHLMAMPPGYAPDPRELFCGSMHAYLPLPTQMTHMDTARRMPPSMPPGHADPRELFCFPGRLARPERIVLFLRGLPGAGKSRLASILHAFEDKCEEIASGDAGPRRTRVIALDDFSMAKGDGGHSKTYLREEVMVPRHRNACAIQLRKSLETRPSSHEFESLVIVDDTNLTKPELLVYLKAIRAVKSAAPSVFVVDVHSDTIPDAMRRTYEPSPQDLPRIDYEALLTCIQPRIQPESNGGARQHVHPPADPPADAPLCLTPFSATVRQRSPPPDQDRPPKSARTAEQEREASAVSDLENARGSRATPLWLLPLI